MNTIQVELVGKSPMLHNRLWSDGSGWAPKDDREQAEGRLFEDRDGSLYLPWHRPLIAIGRAAHSRGVHGAKWPTSMVHVVETVAVLFASRALFAGEWKPQVFLRPGADPVALPRFDAWTATFALQYDPAYYQAETLRELLEFSGRHLGLPQFAPFAGVGPWGLFAVASWEPARVGRLEEASV